ncbi:MAG: hypothetical protein ACI32N_05735 [Bulleidia sp.]
MKTWKRVAAVLVMIVVCFTVFFLAGRHGWKMAGFQACQQAGITTVEVNENAVHITGVDPGSFPEGFCGYYSEEREGKLYVGFRFSAVFGFFESGDFDITIPVSGRIREVIVKSSMSERSVWNSSTDQSDGIYVRAEGSEVYHVSISYEGMENHQKSIIVESGSNLLVDHDIMIKALELNEPVPFTVTLKDAYGTLITSRDFLFDAEKGKMYLTITSDDIMDSSR